MKIILSICLLLLTNFTFAQDTPRDPKFDDKIKSMKIAYLTDKLSLTPDESQKFWPVFNQFEVEMKTLRESRKMANPNFETLSDKDIEKFIDDDINRRQKEVDVIRKYQTQFKQVLPMRKVGLLMRAQEDFKHELLQKIKNRNDAPPPGKSYKNRRP
ncbi:MAG: hypothetical protein JNK61_04450 [Bacteroidia bacterium]|nr:hypothetical protein [Bacteroidia bacterium]